MLTLSSSIRVGIFGQEEAPVGRGIGLWPSGYKGAMKAAGAEPIFLEPDDDLSWDQALKGLNGLVFSGWKDGNPFAGEGLCHWCKDHRVPLLAIDEGMLALNAAFGGRNYQDVGRQVPEALQHRHRPEPGLRHAILVDRGSRLAALYGEGEIVVNSEHRQAIERLAQGFRIGGRALDGVIESIEWQNPNWYCLGVQWQPASATASGLDIQLFRGLVDACARKGKSVRNRRIAVSA